MGLDKTLEWHEERLAKQRGSYGYQKTFLNWSVENVKTTWGTGFDCKQSWWLEQTFAAAKTFLQALQTI